MTTPIEALEAGDTLIFTGKGVLNTRTITADDFLDCIARIRDEYARLKSDALDQMEMWAAQGDISEVSHYSTEAERHNASLLAVTRVLKIAEDVVPALAADALASQDATIRQMREALERIIDWDDATLGDFLPIRLSKDARAVLNGGTK